MTLTCKAFRCTPLANGELQLEIEEPKHDPADDRLNLSEIAKMLDKSKKAIDTLSRRPINPLPLKRGNGHPYGFRSEINQWLRSDPKKPSLAAVLRCFGDRPKKR